MHPVIRQILSAPLAGTGTASYATIFSSASAKRDGILIHVTGGTLEVGIQYEATDVRLYLVEEGETIWLAASPSLPARVKGLGATFNAVEARINP